MSEPAADLALEAYLAGQLAMVVIGGVVTSLVTSLVVEDPLVWFISAIVGIAVALPLGWALSRRTRGRLFEGLDTAEGPVRRTRGAAFAMGARRGVVAVGAVLLVVLVESYLLDVDSYRIAGPVLLASAVGLAYTRHTLLRWQERRAAMVCTRVGVGRFAWTRARARARMVAVPLAATTGRSQSTSL